MSHRSLAALLLALLATLAAGCATLVLPAAEPGRSNGLNASLALAGTF